MISMRGFLKGLYLLICYVIMLIPSWSIRHLFMKMVLYKVGSGCSFFRNVSVTNPKNVSIGNNVILNRNVMLDGRYAKLIIGDDVDIAQETNIWTLEHDVDSDVHKERGGDVIIGDHVWIASRVTILPGVHIGRGAVIASGAVVTKDVPSLEIWGGIPARKIGVRRNSLTYKLNYRPWFQ